MNWLYNDIFDAVTRSAFGDGVVGASNPSYRQKRAAASCCTPQMRSSEANAGTDETARSEEDVPRMRPSANIYETAAGFVIRMLMPGVSKESLDIQRYGKTLEISGLRNEKIAEDAKGSSLEFGDGRFVRRFELGEAIDVDSIKAALKDGVLTVELKKSPEEQPKKIAVQVE